MSTTEQYAELPARLRLAVLRLARELRRGMTELTPSELSALASVDAAGPLRLGDLAAAEGTSPSRITRLVAELQRRGLLDRAPDPADRRSVVVQLSAGGRDLLRRLRAERTAVLGRQLAELDPADLSRLAAAVPVLETIASRGFAELAAATPEATPPRPLGPIQDPLDNNAAPATGMSQGSWEPGRPDDRPG